MNDRPISVTAPLGPAWERTRAALFAPFDLGRWLVLGFAAWLAGLAGGGYNLRIPVGGGDWGGGETWREGVEGAEGAAREAWSTLASAGCLVLVAVLAILVVALLLTALWASSRGRFVFLDNVVTGRAAIVEPWKRWRRQGNSLFLFRLLFGLGLVGVVGLLVLGTVVAVGGLAAIQRDGPLVALFAVPLALVLAATVLLVIVSSVLVAYLLEGFVVPLMHRYELGVLDGWRRFLVLFRAKPWPYLLSGLLLMALHIGVGLALFTAGCLTCCLGFLVLMIPYVGTVVTLPVPYFVRSYTLALLAQADPHLLPPRALP
ncbi:MAG: hypothetical protein R2991_16420 [Thermoanaerobaculia bacterium]